MIDIMKVKFDALFFLKIRNFKDCQFSCVSDITTGFNHFQQVATAHLRHLRKPNEVNDLYLFIGSFRIDTLPSTMEPLKESDR